MKLPTPPGPDATASQRHNYNRKLRYALDPVYAEHVRVLVRKRGRKNAAAKRLKRNPLGKMSPRLRKIWATRRRKYGASGTNKEKYGLTMPPNPGHGLNGKR